MASKSLHYWEVWYPKATATGMLVARGRMDPTDRLLVHAVPDVITVEVYDTDRRPIAKGRDLERTDKTPMCLLTRDGGSVSRTDIWPTDEDLGTPVLLPGGEVGTLMSWWNAGDRQEWRWQLEFYNSRRP